MAVVRPHRGLRIGLAAAVLATLAAGAGGGTPVREADAGVAPRCAYADTVTRYVARSDWYRSLLDTRYRLTRSYAPVDLVPVTRSGASGRGSVRRIALADLTAMFRAARAAGAAFAVRSGYRSYTTQVSTFNRWVLEEGYAAALLGSARAGHSEHQLGTALDLRTPGGPEPWDVADWGRTRAGAWIARNAWRYGWIVSYPKAKSPAATCYQYEPWHIRYFGRIIARKIHDSDLAAREWLYVKGATKTWTGGSPNPTPKPAPKPTFVPLPLPTAAPTPTPVAGPPDEPLPSPIEVASPTAEPSAVNAPSNAPADGASGSPSAAPSEAPSTGAGG
jgi:LAS superfamily LD-carboxypeptidase LdcB